MALVGLRRLARIPSRHCRALDQLPCAPRGSVAWRDRSETRARRQVLCRSARRHLHEGRILRAGAAQSTKRMKLKDRVAVITGSGAGIGRAAAIEFAREGALVVVADINVGGARETAEHIQKFGGESLAVETDVANPESVQNLVRETLHVFSNVHVLFNNAA